MIEPIRIDDLRPDDWRELRALRLEALRTEPGAFGASYEEVLAWTDHDWQQRLAQPGSRYLVARRGEQPMGMVGAYLRTDDGDQTVAVVFGMFVKREIRGHGVGRLLLTTLLADLARHPEVATIRLWVNADNEPARRLYASVGFCVVPELADDASSPDLLCMERPASPLEWD